MRLIKEIRKSTVLKPPAFGCLKGVPSINITRGCMHGCVYCYARGFTDAPPKGEVHLYENLPEMLEAELNRKKRIPSWVSFSTASDCFQDIDEVLKTTYECMRLLLQRGIGVIFLTKGYIPQEFIELFKKHRDLTKARIGIVSLGDNYKKLFEPNTASPSERLINIKNLIYAGVEVSVRIDPVIPSVTDRTEHLVPLLRSLKEAGVKKISANCLVMRPSIVEFFNEIPSLLSRRILGFYRGQPWQTVITSAKTKLLPAGWRIAFYKRIKSMADPLGINCLICGCKNPDLPWEYCSPWINEGEVEKQMGLFRDKVIEPL